jgi:mitochondrial fission protein ELM1
MSEKNVTTWIITEGMAGTENQCLGVAEALGVNPRIIQIQLKAPWRMLSPYLSWERDWSFTPAITTPWPELLLTSGRKAISASRFIKKQSQGKTFTVHIQDPRINPIKFDLVAVPHHDPTRGQNVIVTDAAPNRLTIQKLEAAKVQFPKLQNLPSPRIAVLIGGTSKAYTMTKKVTEDLIQQLLFLQERYQASLMITASRRTGEENRSLLQQAFNTKEHIYFWDGQGDNPYLGFLAHADYILVTADSVSMISDALTTGKPTYLIPLEGGARRLQNFHNHIIRKGYARFFEGHLEPYEYLPLSDAQNIAQEIRLKSGLFSE